MTDESYDSGSIGDRPDDHLTMSEPMDQPPTGDLPTEPTPPVGAAQNTDQWPPGPFVPNAEPLPAQPPYAGAPDPSSPTGSPSAYPPSFNPLNTTPPTPWPPNVNPPNPAPQSWGSVLGTKSSQPPLPSARPPM